MNKEVNNNKRVQSPKERAARIAAAAAKYLTAALVLLLLFWFGFTHTVREGDCAVVLRFGAVREEITEAGLYMKLPWPFEKVVTYDARVQYIEPDRLETTTKDKQNIILQSFVVYEISDPVLYHNSVGVNGTLDAYMRDQVFSATNSTLGGYNLSALVSLEQEEIRIDEIQQEIFSRVQENCQQNYGVNVLDVSIMRLSFPDNNLETVFEQMRAEREGAITEIINAAEEEVNKIKTDAEEDAADKVAAGVTEAAGIKAEAEKEVAALYAKAQSANIELYKFLKNLDTIVASVNSSTVLVVKTDEYPFNILAEYSKHMEIEGDKTVIRDLTYILTQLDEADRTALINKVGALLAYASLGEKAKPVNALDFLLAQLEGGARNALTAKAYALIDGDVLAALEARLAALETAEEKQALEKEVMTVVNYYALEHGVTLSAGATAVESLRALLGALGEMTGESLTIEIYGLVEPNADGVTDAIATELAAMTPEEQELLNGKLTLLVEDFAERYGIVLP